MVNDVPTAGTITRMGMQSCCYCTAHESVCAQAHTHEDNILVECHSHYRSRRVQSTCTCTCTCLHLHLHLHLPLPLPLPLYLHLQLHLHLRLHLHHALRVASSFGIFVHSRVFTDQGDKILGHRVVGVLQANFLDPQQRHRQNGAHETPE